MLQCGILVEDKSKVPSVLSDKIYFHVEEIINYLLLQVLMNDVQSEVDAQMMQDVYSNDLNKDTLLERSTTVRRQGPYPST